MSEIKKINKEEIYRVNIYSLMQQINMFSSQDKNSKGKHFGRKGIEARRSGGDNFQTLKMILE